MSRFAQVEMEPVYGLCHYILHGLHNAFFRGPVAGLHNIPREGPFLIAANHSSHLDPPFIGANVPRQIAFFARKSLWKGGVGSWWMDHVGSIPVEREGGDVQAIKRVLQTLQSGKALILFPEGTRSEDGSLQPAKAGVGLIACKTRVPVLPVRIFGSHIAFGKGRPLRPGTPVSIVFGRMLQPADYDHAADGKERYQRASERIMTAIAALQEPRAAVV